MPYVTGATILAQAGVAAPTAADTTWANQVAAALESAIEWRMQGVTDYTTNADITADLTRAALVDGTAAYAERQAPHGIVSLGPDGDVVRLGRDMLRALEPVFFRYAGPGIG